MIDRFARLATRALLLSAVAAGCTPDGQSVATAASTTSVPTSVEPIDFAALNGKTIRIKGMASGNYSVVPPETQIDLRVIGKTVVWGNLIKSNCILKGVEFDNMAVLYALDRPRTGVKIPCEAGRKFSLHEYSVTAPADVSYSSTMTLQGNVLELSGELTEHSSVTDEGGIYGSGSTTTKDIEHHQHVKVRISGDKCQVLEFAWTMEAHSIEPGGRVLHRRSVRATGCSIVAQPT